MTADHMDRRTVLRTAGIAAVGGIGLAACSSNNTSNTTMPEVTGAGSTTTGDAMGGATTSAGAGMGGSTTSSGGAAMGTALGKTADIPLKGGAVFQNEKVVVTQPASGEYKAFTAVCTHQQCLVNQISNNVISCPCHGSKFSAKDGSVVSGPAMTGLAAKTINVKSGEISLEA
jgi:nitrite reductase/ring-hydroxylating ferredoxin subunit